MATHDLPLAAGTNIEIFGLLVGLLGGLALFLYGMDQMAGALKAVAGDRMRAILARLTGSRLRGVFTGAFVTAVIQSSSVTTVLVVGFVSAGLLSMVQSVGVIMGANVGTTITAQIIAFKVTKAALLLIAIGFGMTFISRRPSTRRHGTILLGLGLVFFGMNVMADAMHPLREYPPFLQAMTRFETPLVGILAGAVFTALVQSSSATTGVVIVLASQGLITLPAGIAIVLGANVGTCVTALLAAVGKPREAVRAAWVHVLFNVAGVLLWLGLVDQLAGMARWMSPEGDTPREIANSHTIFNLSCMAVFLPFAGVFASLVERLVPDRPDEEAREVRAKYLDEDLLPTPALALDRVRLELLHLGNRTKEMLEAILPAMLTGTREELETVAAWDDQVDVLHGRILEYLGRVGREQLTGAETADLVHLMEATNDLENIGDIIEINLTALGLQRLEQGIRISEATQQVLTDFHGEVVRALDTALMAVTQTSVEAARAVRGMKAEVNRMAKAAAAHGADRLRAQEPHRLPAYAIEMDMLENLKRVYYFARRMARVVVSRKERS